MTLKELRLQSGKTAAEVAAELKITENAIYNYEKGIRSINIWQALRLSKFFEVTAEEIIKAQLNSIIIGSAD